MSDKGDKVLIEEESVKIPKDQFLNTQISFKTHQ